MTACRQKLMELKPTLGWKSALKQLCGVSLIFLMDNDKLFLIVHGITYKRFIRNK
jgi:hypothetical protein